VNRGINMSGSVLTSNGRITIPKDVRERMRIHAGDRVEFTEIEPGVFEIYSVFNDITELKGMVKISEGTLFLK